VRSSTDAYNRYVSLAAYCAAARQVGKVPAAVIRHVQAQAEPKKKSSRSVSRRISETRRAKLFALM
jgi:hypothetical protein